MLYDVLGISGIVKEGPGTLLCNFEPWSDHEDNSWADIQQLNIAAGHYPQYQNLLHCYITFDLLEQDKNTSYNCISSSYPLSLVDGVAKIKKACPHHKT